MQGALIISHGVSQGVSHAKKIHMVFTCISHSFHNMTKSSAYKSEFNFAPFGKTKGSQGSFGKTKATN